MHSPPLQHPTNDRTTDCSARAHNQQHTHLTNTTQHHTTTANSVASGTGGDGTDDPSNTTVFVGGIDAGKVTEETLRERFTPFGEVSVAGCVGCGCGLQFRG
jgi:RNA recognition motif-containing protein